MMFPFCLSLSLRVRAVRALSVPELQSDALLLVCHLMRELGSEFATLGYLSQVHATVLRQQIQSEDYNLCLQALTSEGAFPSMKKVRVHSSRQR